MQAWPEFLRAPFLRALNKAQRMLSDAVKAGPAAKAKHFHVHRGQACPIRISPLAEDLSIAQGIAWALKGDWEFQKWRRETEKGELGLDRAGRDWLDSVDDSARCANGDYGVQTRG